MEPLASRLERLGFCLDNWGYYSFRGSVDEHAIHLRTHLASMHGDGKQFHIVAHSLGGRHCAIASCDGPGWCLPVLRQLSDAKESFVCSLPPPKDMEFGELTATYDFLVATSSMHLLGEKDFAAVGGTHGSILFYSQTAAMIASFLRTGKFDLA